MMIDSLCRRTCNEMIYKVLGKDTCIEPLAHRRYMLTAKALSSHKVTFDIFKVRKGDILRISTGCPYAFVCLDKRAKYVKTNIATPVCHWSRHSVYSCQCNIPSKTLDYVDCSTTSIYKPNYKTTVMYFDDCNYHCSVCLYFGNDHKEEVFAHVRKVHKNLVCDKGCIFMVMDPVFLKFHKATHTKMKTCDVCLKQYKLVHNKCSGKNNFLCERCGGAYSSYKSMNRHRNICKVLPDTYKISTYWIDDDVPSLYQKTDIRYNLENYKAQQEVVNAYLKTRVDPRQKKAMKRKSASDGRPKKAPLEKKSQQEDTSDDGHETSEEESEQPPPPQRQKTCKPKTVSVTRCELNVLIPRNEKQLADSEIVKQSAEKLYPLKKRKQLMRPLSSDDEREECLAEIPVQGGSLVDALVQKFSDSDSMSSRDAPQEISQEVTHENLPETEISKTEASQYLIISDVENTLPLTEDNTSPPEVTCIDPVETLQATQIVVDLMAGMDIPPPNEVPPLLCVYCDRTSHDFTSFVSHKSSHCTEESYQTVIESTLVECERVYKLDSSHREYIRSYLSTVANADKGDESEYIMSSSLSLFT